MQINGEAIHGTRPVWPYQWGGAFVSASSSAHAYYVMVPAMQPDDRSSTAVERAPVPTGGQPVGGGGGTGKALPWVPSQLHVDLQAGKQLSLPWLRPSLFATPITKVELLGGSAPITYTLNDTAGMVVDGITGTPTPAPAPPFDCKAFGCTCAGMGDYYGVGPSPGCGGFGCAPADAQHWWVVTMQCTAAAYAKKAVHRGCSDAKCGSVGPAPPGAKVPPQNLGLVIKISF